MIALHCLTRPQLDQLLTRWGFAASHARQIWSYLYRDLVVSIDEMDKLSPKLLAKLQAEAYLTRLTSARETTSDARETHKYLLQLPDGEPIETVQMHYGERVTACLSSQVGCALGCVFCATGQLGFTRNLTADEIVAQALHVARAAGQQNRRLTNLVLMGMGEPLLNYDAVLTACDILHDPGSLAIGAKQITISTVGVIPGIIRLAEEARKYSLAVSLHAASQDERLSMIPAARPWPLEELIAACHYYTSKLNQKIFFEWTLISGQNDSAEHAQQLAALLLGVPAQVNLIPLNPTSRFGGTPAARAAAGGFQAVLAQHGIPSSIRQRRGIEIAAGCGQLAGLNRRTAKSFSRTLLPVVA